jgi:hypothetical protein
MKALTVEFEFIAQCMRDLSRETNDYYLSLSTGKVFSLSRTLIRSLCESGESRPPLPQWDAKMIPVARAVVLEGNPDYVRIPEAFGCPEHKWMTDFAGSISSVKLKEKMFSALRGRGSCARFKAILKENPEETKQWVQFCAKRWQDRIQSWFEELGVIAVSENRARAAAG